MLIYFAVLFCSGITWNVVLLAIKQYSVLFFLNVVGVVVVVVVVFKH